MDEFFQRQLTILKDTVSRYRAGTLGLNKVVQHLEAVTNLVNDQKWRDQVFPIIVNLEQINASLIVFGGEPTQDDLVIIKNAFEKLDAVMQSIWQGN